MADQAENLKNGKVIVTYGRSVMALVAAHSLGKKGIEIVGSDSIDFTALSFSSYVDEFFIYPDPEKDEEAFVSFMLDMVKKHAPEDKSRPYVLMPVYKDTKLLAKHKERFEPYIKVATPDYDAISKLHPKDNLARTTDELDVDVPQSWLPEDENELKEIKDAAFSYPVLIKPYDQSGGRGIHKVDNFEDLLSAWRENDKRFAQKSLIQNAVEGKDYCLTALFDHGELKASMAYRNVHRFPVESGAGTLRETVEDDRFQVIAKDLMKPLKWNGVAEFDFLWDEKEESTPSLIEVNTRFWGGLFQSVESGIDFPWLLYKLTVQAHVEQAGEANIGTRTKMPYIWLVSAVQDVISSDEDFKEIERRGQQALAKMRGGNWLEGFQDYMSYLSSYISETLNIKKKIDKFKIMMETGKSARNEILSSDDPYAAFGILFIIGSLIRQGHLPQEVKY